MADETTKDKARSKDAGQKTSRVRESAGGTKEASAKEVVAEKVEQAREATREKAERLRQQASETRDRARESYEETVDHLRDGYSRFQNDVGNWGDDLGDFVRESPAKAVLIACGAGFLIGLLFRGRGRDPHED